jgi:hypothetical protein
MERLTLSNFTSMVNGKFDSCEPTTTIRPV